MIEHLEEDWLLTGNEDDCSYTYIIKNTSYQFHKTITFNYDKNYDIYEESFVFDTYHFIVGKKIPKVSNMATKDKDITMDFVKIFICDIQEEDYCQRWKLSRETDITFIPSSDMLKTHSHQLYDKYIKYYPKLINAPSWDWVTLG
jgi:hypothetical protein